MDHARLFYDREYQKSDYATSLLPEEHAHFPDLRRFIDGYGLQQRRCLEIGCGRGCFQDIVNDYTGVDYSESARSFLHKPFHCASAAELPFADNSFDAAWSIAVL